MNLEEKKLREQINKFPIRTVILNYFLKRGIKRSDELKIFLGKVVNIRVSDRVICGNPKHTPPFNFLRDVFLLKVFDALVLANRSGGKSFLAGLITFLRSLFYNSSTRILGGSFDQSEKSYTAFKSFWEISGTEMLLRESKKSNTRCKRGAQIEILTASDKSVRGPHQPNLVLDEVEEMEERIMKAALSQPQSDKWGKASTLFISTRHKADGLMSRLLKRIDEMGLTFYSWCIWDNIQSCKDYKCSTCPLSAICPGKEMKNANGYYLIEDLVQKLKQLDNETFSTEWLCEKPSRVHLVYPEFSEDKHIINHPWNPGLPTRLSIDWGGVDPFVVLIWQRSPEFGDIIVDEIYMPNTDNQTVIAEYKRRRYRTDLIAFCDPSRQDVLREWKAIGIRATGVHSKLDDISLVRTKLKPMKGKVSLYVNRTCKKTIQEFNSYPRDDNGHPKDINNHACDAIRYYIRGMKSYASESRDEPFQILKGPSVEQYIRQQGLERFNPKNKYKLRERGDFIRR